MRWKGKSHPKEGDIQIVHRFLLFPVKFQNETRWLEWAWIKKTYLCLRDEGEGWMWYDWADGPEDEEKS
jgi:hypothetical protein